MSALVDNGVDRVAWHRGRLIRQRLDPVTHARLTLPAHAPWRALVVGDEGALEYRPESRSQADPVACYPVWRYGWRWALLESYVASNVGDEGRRKADDPLHEAKPGQEHRIIISGVPNALSPEGRSVLSELGDLQDENPHVILHLWEAASFRPPFGFGFAACDLDPMAYATRNKINLPNGAERTVDKLQKVAKWVNLMGYSIADLHTVEARVDFNVRAALWAGEHYNDTVPTFNSHKGFPAKKRDYRTSPMAAVRLSVNPPQEGDMVACDSCSLADKCKLYRPAGVCTLAGSETANLAAFFKTRDSERIIQGLGSILAVQAERAERAVADEKMTGELDRELTKLLTTVFDGGVKLAKLVDPALAAAGAPRIGVQVNTLTNASNPKAMMAAVVAELEARGVPRDQITAEMVLKLASGSEELREAHEVRAIEATVVE